MQCQSKAQTTDDEGGGDYGKGKKEASLGAWGRSGRELSFDQQNNLTSLHPLETALGAWGWSGGERLTWAAGANGKEETSRAPCALPFEVPYLPIPRPPWQFLRHQVRTHQSLQVGLVCEIPCSGVWKHGSQSLLKGVEASGGQQPCHRAAFSNDQKPRRQKIRYCKHAREVRTISILECSSSIAISPAIPSLVFPSTANILRILASHFSYHR